MSSSLSSFTVGNLSFDTKDPAEDQLGLLKIDALRVLYVEIGGTQDPANDFGEHHRAAHIKITRACMVILEHRKLVVYNASENATTSCTCPRAVVPRPGRMCPQHPPSKWHRSGARNCWRSSIVRQRPHANTKLAQGPLRQVRPLQGGYDFRR